jgi:uncharacterized paraquat-inducible protein A
VRLRCPECGLRLSEPEAAARNGDTCPRCGDLLERVPLVRPIPALLALGVSAGLLAWSLPVLRPASPPPSLPSEPDVA